ncbi:MAG: hypothetical protein D6741_06310 [Planctomycetota bacterium]|nr:MAG: hypothetical protein D6741_06310 [Planctomycetota bacterium]
MLLAYLYKYGNKTLLQIALYWADRGLNKLCHFNMREWMILFVITILIGGVCMRGFGSRKEY